MNKKILLICISVALAVALFCGVFAVLGWGSLLYRVGGTVIYPFQWVGDRVRDGVTGFAAYFRDIRDLQEKIESLKQENEQLKSELTDAAIMQDESSWLYGYLYMKDEHEDYEMCAATVISTTAPTASGGTYITRLTLNKGAAHGIELHMPVVTTLGLVGMVTEVGPDYCCVKTILDPTSSVSAVTTRSGDRGLVEGDFSYLYEGEAILRYLPEAADVAVEDILVTSGDGGVYPYGIPIGIVDSVSKNPYNRTTEAVIRPLTDFSDLDQVVILTSYTRGIADGTSGGEGSS